MENYILQVAKKGAPCWYGNNDYFDHKTFFGALIHSARYIFFRTHVSIIFGENGCITLRNFGVK